MLQGASAYHIKPVQRKYGCLKKNADSKHAYSIRAPRLIGFIVNDSDKGVIIILEEYVPHITTLGRSQNNKKIATERRRK